MPVAFYAALELALVASLVALGVFLTFRILNTADLTVEASLPLGAAVTAAGLAAGWNPWVATGVATLCGAFAGFATALTSLRLRLSPLLVSFFVVTAFFALRPRIGALADGHPESPDTIFTALHIGALDPASARPLALLAIVVVAGVIVALFLKTNLGLAMRASSANPAMARANGIRVDIHLLIGIVASNTAAAFAGALLVALQGMAALDTGLGTFVAALAAMLIGEAMVPRRGSFLAVIGVVLGALIYALATGLALQIEVLRLTRPDIVYLTAVGVAAALGFRELHRRRTGAW